MSNTSDHVFCPTCGIQVPAGAAVCRGCGEELPRRAAAETKPCPHCAASLPLEAQFCGTCGKPAADDAPMTDDAPAPASPPGFFTFVGEAPRPRNPQVAPAPPTAATPAPPPPPPPPPPPSASPAGVAPAPQPPPPPSMTAAPPRQPPPPPRPGAASERESWPVGRTIAIVATVLLLGGSIAAAVVLSRGSDEKPAAARDATPEPQPTEAPPEATAAPDDAQLPRQVETLDRLLKVSVEGRAEALGGDFAAAAKSRSTLLRELRSLQADVTDAQLRAAVTAFIAAVREALRQNRECTASCSTSELERVGRLKRQALGKINPLLRAQGMGTYKSSEI